MATEERCRPAEIAVRRLTESVTEAARLVPSVVLYAFAALGLVFDFWLFVLAG